MNPRAVASANRRPDRSGTPLPDLAASGHGPVRADVLFSSGVISIPQRRLVGAHLVEQTGSDRYRFHDLLRSYVQDQIRREESGSDREATLDGLLHWYLHTADAAAR